MICDVIVFPCLPHIQKTHAFHRLQDDVPVEVKQRRLEECITVFRGEAERVNAALIGSTQLVLVEGVSNTHTVYQCVIKIVFKYMLTFK